MTTTQIEAAAAEFRDWLDGFPLAKTSKDLIAAKAAEIFGRKHAGGAGVDDYWLLRALTERVAGNCERQPYPCESRQLCITESCLPCAARWWLEQNVMHADQPTK
jgi:hypothetical protein